MNQLYQILKLDRASGTWKFVAHGARYSKEDADLWAAQEKERGGEAMLIKCRRPRNGDNA